jgi:heat shock protein HslJ
MNEKTPRRLTRFAIGLGALLALTPLTLPAAPQPPADSRWVLTDIASLDSIDPSITRIEVDAEGNISGTAGCNRLHATRDKNRYSEIGVTRKHCEEYRMRQEEAFLAALRETADWEMDEGRLILRDRKGERLAVMDEPLRRRYHFVCGKETIRFEVIAPDRIRLTHAGGTLVLEQTRSASGTRYASDDGRVVFWGKGTQGRFEVDGETRECRQIPNPD